MTGNTESKGECEYRISQEACKFLINHISDSRILNFDEKTFLYFLTHEFLKTSNLEENDKENMEKIEKMKTGSLIVRLKNTDIMLSSMKKNGVILKFAKKELVEAIKNRILGKIINYNF
jgi:hypothetical protein